MRDYIVAYHGTSEAHIAEIEREGLTPRHGLGGDAWASEHGLKVARNSAKRPPSVYVSTERDHSEQFALIAAEETNSAPVLLRLHIPRDAFKAQFVPDEYSEEPVPAFLQLLGVVAPKPVDYRTEHAIPADWIAAKLTPKAKHRTLMADIVPEPAGGLQFA